MCQVHGSGNVVHRNTWACTCLSECFAIRAREAVYYVRKYYKLFPYLHSCMHTHVNNYIHTYIYTYTHILVCVYVYVHLYNRQTHTHTVKDYLKKRTYFHPRQGNTSKNWQRLLSNATSRNKRN